MDDGTIENIVRSLADAYPGEISNSMENHTLRQNVTRSLALGLSPDHAFAATQMRIELTRAISKVKELAHMTEKPTEDTNIYLGPKGLFLRYDDSLLLLWEEFAKVLCHYASHGHECHRIDRLCISNVQLTKEILNILEPALKAVPIHDLWIINTGLRRDVMKFAAELLKANPFIKFLSLHKNKIKNKIESVLDTLSLLKAAKKSHLNMLDLGECGIGLTLSVPEIVPGLLQLHAVFLTCNEIQTRGVNLISSGLAANPCIKHLYLNDNLLNDEDATLLGSSLKTNTNLVELSMLGNAFTAVGIKTLCKSIHDDQSLKSIYGSNHTCQLILFTSDQPAQVGMDEEIQVLDMNVTRLDYGSNPRSTVKKYSETAKSDLTAAAKNLLSKGYMKAKIIFALHGNSNGDFNRDYLKEVPMELMPRVLAFLQESEKFAWKGERNLDILFQVIRSRPVDFCGIPSEDVPVYEAPRMKVMAALVVAAAIALTMLLGRQY